MGPVLVEDFRFFIFMQKPDRHDPHFAAVVRGCTIQAADQRPGRVDGAARFI